MAPELVRRYSTDERLDVFAFGVTAFELCTFQRPWAGRATDVSAMTHAMTAMSHIEAPADIKQYRPQINPVLANAIHACIEPELRKRCPSMEKFLQNIRRIKHEDKE
jgi:serine/threonine-protein kinase